MPAGHSAQEATDYAAHFSLGAFPYGKVTLTTRMCRMNYALLGQALLPDAKHVAILEKTYFMGKLSEIA